MTTRFRRALRLGNITAKAEWTGAALNDGDFTEGFGFRVEAGAGGQALFGKTGNAFSNQGWSLLLTPTGSDFYANLHLARASSDINYLYSPLCTGDVDYWGFVTLGRSTPTLKLYLAPYGSPPVFITPSAVYSAGSGAVTSDASYPKSLGYNGSQVANNPTRFFFNGRWSSELSQSAIQAMCLDMDENGKPTSVHYWKAKAADEVAPLLLDESGNGYDGTLAGIVSFVDGPDAGAPTVSVTTQPSNTASGAAIAPAVVVTSSDGADSSTVFSVTLIGSGATLSGTMTATMVSGVLTLAALTITGAGTGFRLRFTSDEYEPLVSATFDITGGGGGGGGSPATLLLTDSNMLPQAIQLGTTSNIVKLLVRDTDGHLVPGLAHGDVTLSISTNNGAPANVTLNGSGSIGTFASASFLEIEGTLEPGAYQFGVPNANVATGGGRKWIDVCVKGTDIDPAPQRIFLTGDDIYAAKPTLTEIKNNVADKTVAIMAAAAVSSDGSERTIPYTTGDVTETLVRRERSTTIEGVS